MRKQLETYKATRQFLLKTINDLSVEELNKIPSGFNNNIIWNMAHLVASQQGVCYKRAGLDLVVEEAYFQAYKPDTKPQGLAEPAEIELTKNLLISTIEQFEIDYNHQLFSRYPSWITRYGVELSSIDDALTFLPFHEGIHFGYIMALKRVIKTP
jgi:hypothetical protein